MTQSVAITLRGKEAIAAAIGVRVQDVGRLVREEGLPAYREDNKGPWRATVVHLQQWAAERAEKHLAR